MLNITKKVDADSILISLEGRLDTNTASRLEAELQDAPTAPALVLDLEKLEYISSAGLRVFLSAQKKTRGKMKIVHVGETVMEIFEVTGFSDILDIE